MDKDRRYELDLVSMKDGHHEMDWHIDKRFFEDRENSDILGADIDVALDIEKRRDSYDLSFQFDGTLDVACDRCLEAMPIDVEEDYHVVVRHGEEYDDSGDDLLVIPENWTRLDVAPLIYDSLLLAIPLRCVHPEGECDSRMSEVLREHGDTDADEEPED